MASSRRPQPRPRPVAPRAPRSTSQGGRYPPRGGTQRGAASGGQSAGGGTTWTTPDAGPFRTRVETSSRVPLLRMHAAPRWALFLAFLGLAVGAALAPSGFGALCAVVLATFLSWLLFLAWPRLAPAPRALRILVIAILIGAAIAKLVLG